MDSSAPSNPGTQGLDLDALMEKIRAEVAERQLHAGAVVRTEPTQVVPANFATRKWSARELLALPAADFARATHLAFFGREPSPDEFVRLRDRLLIHGVGRMRILREFCRSPEARRLRLPIGGLTQQFLWDRIYWSPPAKFGRFVGRGARNVWLLPHHVRTFIGRVEALERRAAEITGGLRNVQSALVTDRQNANRNVRRLQETIEGDNKRTGMRIGDMDRRFGDRLTDISAALASAETRLAQAETKLLDHWRGIVEHKLGLENLAVALQPNTDSSPHKTRVAGMVTRETAHLLDPLYLSFEDRYRGTRADIKERQRVYLPYVEACYAVTGGAQLVDIGCGRGEWLEILSDAGIMARGYDLNRIAVEECSARGLQADLCDGLEALGALPSESCSAVTAFHVIEHLPFESLVKLLDESLRVLRPGGVLVLETPNPGNLIVAAERFYLDPTHRNPLPSELTGYLVQSRGFQDVQILPLHPMQRESLEEYSDPMLRLLQDKLFGPQDYGAIGRKSA
jgi:2-polyprenyl-3-methyl-5-hydroxy-6-metoxy-1,4-benzoquinol methylase